MGNLGEGILAAIFLLCGFAAVFGWVSLKLEIETAKKVFSSARQAVLIAAPLSVAAILLLLTAFLVDDFSLDIVRRYSSKTLPFYYKLSALWAGSAGSLLLWSVFTLVFFALWVKGAKTDNMRFTASALSIGAGICLGLSAILLFVEKPFARCLVTVDDGLGLNPLLQNFWMVVHPPIVFVGYSAFVVPFVIVLAGVFAGRAGENAFYSQPQRWLLLGICFLSLGIATGARWSYVELGWGGYWAWDPVENASLLPWLIAVAALHALIGARITEKFKLISVVLTPLPFILCLLGTFVTRSGILLSIHSFGQNMMFSALLVFIGCVFLLWLACIIKAARNIAAASEPTVSRLSQAEVLFWTDVVLVLTAIVIGFATFWPVILPFFTNSNVMLTRVFYDRIICIPAVLLALLIGLGALTGLQERGSLSLRVLVCCAAGLIVSAVIFKQAHKQLLMSLTCGICAFSFVAVSAQLWLNLKNAGQIGAGTVHLALLLLVVAVGFSALEQSAQSRLTKGGRILLGKYEFVYDSFASKSLDGTTQVGPEIVVRKGGLVKRLWPHNNLYPTGHITHKVAIHMEPFEDIYISLDHLADDGTVVITAKIKPFMYWLWFTSVLIVTGSALAALESRKIGHEK